MYLLSKFSFIIEYISLSVPLIHCTQHDFRVIVTKETFCLYDCRMDFVIPFLKVSYRVLPSIMMALLTVKTKLMIHRIYIETVSV